VTPSVIFLVGMPRSGTKLLRDLLNHHEDVAIFPHETHFFRPLRKKFRSYGDIRNWQEFARLYSDIKDATFFRRMESKGSAISAEDWYRHLQGSEFCHLLQGLFSSFSQTTGCRIVGDKTPSYITELPMLGSCFPDAKFIHIVRDPRDYALSIRKAWRKDLMRATQRWKQGIRKCRRDATECELEYLEVKYEELVLNPGETLRKTCEFLGISFSESMLVFERPTENIGDARGAMSVVSNNIQKWTSRLDTGEVEKLESIAGSLMVELGYPVMYCAGNKDVSSGRMALGRALDTINRFRYAVREERSVVAGLKQLWRESRFG
jgi:hypothetical protein